jgi:hypothetical protein
MASNAILSEYHTIDLMKVERQSRWPQQNCLPLPSIPMPLLKEYQFGSYNLLLQRQQPVKAIPSLPIATNIMGS